MFSVNKYESSYPQFGSKHAPKETSTTNYNRKYAGMKYHINGGGRDTYVYNN